MNKRNPFDTVPENADPLNLNTPVHISESSNYAALKASIEEALRVGSQVVIVPKGSKGIIVSKEFNPLIKEKIEELEIELKEIKAISSQDDAVKANVTLKKAKTLIKTLSSERLLMTSVLDEEKADTMRYEKEVTGNLVSMVDIVNNAITTFQIAEQARLKKIADDIEKEKQTKLLAENAEIQRKATIKGYILEFEKNCLNALQEANVMSIDMKIKQLATFTFDTAIYQEFTTEAYEMYKAMVAKFETRSAELKKIAQANATEAAALQLQAEEQARKDREALAEKEEKVNDAILEESQSAASNIQMEAELKTSIVPKAKGISLPWVFDEETIDMSLLPAEFHTYDKAKIKAAITGGRKEIPGVNIYQKVTNVSR
jgi:hypothetical protein